MKLRLRPTNSGAGVASLNAAVPETKLWQMLGEGVQTVYT